VETKVLSGKPVAACIHEEVERCSAALEPAPTLAIVLVGDDPASVWYSHSIERAGAKHGVSTRLITIDPGDGAERVEGILSELSLEAGVDGIILQRPLPPGVPPGVVERIVPTKDVDCATTYSLGLLMRGAETFVPCTALAVLEMLDYYELSLPGKDVVIVGRSMVVGRPLANLMLRKSDLGNATVTVCHTRTADLAAHTRRADIVVVAAGRPGALTGDMVAEGAVVIDVGTNQVDDPSSDSGHRLVGDIEFDQMMGRASAVTPVPGGVGTLTTALLLRSVVIAAERTRGSR
jgi:methylenetetrahydrofolate dehydrogenase (NADP+) / methenyltetrahydrofolate cyclohydrolase